MTSPQGFVIAGSEMGKTKMAEVLDALECASQTTVRHRHPKWSTAHMCVGRGPAGARGGQSQRG